MTGLLVKLIRLVGFVPACISGALLANVPVGADMLDDSAVEPWETCALCHGASGISANSKFPYLAGQKQAYLIEQVRAFQSGRRSNDGGQMRAISQELDADKLAAATAYFAGLPPADFSRATPAPPSTGAALYFSGRAGVPACISCHGDVGSNAPWLESQHRDYLTKQLLDFGNGTRRPTDAAMSRIATALTDTEIKALTEFLSKARPHAMGRGTGLPH